MGWEMLFLFCSFSLLSGLYWCTYVPIASATALHYCISPDLVPLFELSFFLLFFPTAPVAVWALRQSLYWSLWVCCGVNAVGAVLRSVYIESTGRAELPIGTIRPVLSGLSQQFSPNCSKYSDRSLFPAQGKSPEYYLGQFGQFPRSGDRPGCAALSK